MDPTSVSLAFAQSLARRRKSLGLTQTQLAERLGMARETISRIECGHRDAHAVEFLARYADALECNLDTLFRDALRG